MKKRIGFKMKKFSFTFKKRKFNLNVKHFEGLRNFTTGLMFLSRKKANALLFDFKKPKDFSFSGFFVFFPFLILFLDEKNNTIKMKKVSPFTWHVPTPKPYFRVLEIPINGRYRDIVKLLFS